MRAAPSPATLALMREGIAGKDLAQDLGISPQAISQQLAGQTRSSPELIDAIKARGTKALAREVATLIEATREKRAS